MLRYLSWLAALLIFLAALGFALKNSAPVTLHYYLGYQWQGPLVLALLAAFGGGAAAGAMAALSYMIRQRRQILQLRRELRGRAQAAREEAH